MISYQVEPGKPVKIKDFDPKDTSWCTEGKKTAGKAFKAIRKELVELQHLLYAEYKRKVLIVFQAMDCGGKDGTIRSVFKGANPQGVKAAGFRAPTTDELDHDYLWRVHAQTPGKGEITIFNRSHYEDVLVVRVHDLVPESVWSQRYRHIVDFERMLADEGTTILKFFLHISKKEQKERFLERIHKPEKQWKFNAGDLDERKLWDQYMMAYEDAINRTSTDFAPWYIIPADRNWYRNYVVAEVITNTLKDLGMKYPQPDNNIAQYKNLID